MELLPQKEGAPEEVGWLLASEARGWVPITFLMHRSIRLTAQIAAEERNLFPTKPLTTGPLP